jgi:hypothetical protein
MGIPFWFEQTGNRIPNDKGDLRWHAKTPARYRECFDRLDGERVQELPVPRTREEEIKAD